MERSDHPPSVRTPDWATLRRKAAAFPEPAFQFVREGLAYTVAQVHALQARANLDANARRAAGSQAELFDESDAGVTEDVLAGGASRHVSGQQLSMGLRDFAVRRYGSLAGAVMRRWGVRSTDDWGVIVYAMIDRGEMRAGERDSIDDFTNVFDFEEAFATEQTPRRADEPR
jgi:uncharacterized repeat protein (TIGR04138 family)